MYSTELMHQQFLITVDYFSNFWEIDLLELITASRVIRELKAHFARYGISSTLISDNGSQLTSRVFKEFAKAYDFQHQKSSPHYQHSNGMTESAVKTAKKLLRQNMTVARTHTWPS